MSNLLVADYPLLVLPSLAQKVGLNEALVLQQVHYWLTPRFKPHQIEGKFWVYNTYEQWQEQFPFWCQKTIQRTILKLQKMEILESFISKRQEVTKYYTINYEALDKLVEVPLQRNEEDHLNRTTCPDRTGQSVPTEQDNLSCSIYTETPTEIPSFSSSNDVANENSAEERKKKNNDDEFWMEWITVWNQEIHDKLHPGKATLMTSNRLEMLEKLRRTVFINGIDEWKDYCGKIKRNPFLMGENDTGFKVNLEWALRSDNAVRILEGGIYGEGYGEKTPEVTEEAFLQNLETRLGHTDEGVLWHRVCKNMIHYEGLMTVKLWLEQMNVRKIGSERILIGTTSSFFKTYVENTFGAKIRRIIEKAYPGREVVFTVGGV